MQDSDTPCTSEDLSEPRNMVKSPRKHGDYCCHNHSFVLIYLACVIVKPQWLLHKTPTPSFILFKSRNKLDWEQQEVT